MNYKIRKSDRNWDGKWKTVKSRNDIMSIISGLSPSETLEVKRVCDHKNTFIDSGIRVCKDCQEHLEVTSWRD